VYRISAFDWIVFPNPISGRRPLSFLACSSLNESESEVTSSYFDAIVSRKKAKAYGKEPKKPRLRLRKNRKSGEEIISDDEV